MIYFNGNRNFESASTIVSEILRDQKPESGPSYEVSMFRENLMQIDEDDYPFINVITEAIDPTGNNGADSNNDVVVAVYMGVKRTDSGIENTINAKQQLMGLAGWVNAMIVKYNNYYPGGNLSQICNIKPGSIKFTGVDQYNTDGTVLAIQELTIKMTENDNDLFTNRLREVFTRADDYNWDYVQL